MIKFKGCTPAPTAPDRRNEAHVIDDDRLGQARSGPLALAPVTFGTNWHPLLLGQSGHQIAGKANGLGPPANAERSVYIISVQGSRGGRASYGSIVRQEGTAYHFTSRYRQTCPWQVRLLLGSGYPIFSYAPCSRRFNPVVAGRHRKDGRVNGPFFNLNCLT